MVHRGSGQIFRFGPYEFEPNGHDLRKHGVRIRLQGQPLQLLAALLETPGEVVLRVCRFRERPEYGRQAPACGA